MSRGKLLSLGLLYSRIISRQLRSRSTYIQLGVFGAAALGVLEFYQPARELERAPFAARESALAALLRPAEPTPNAFGRSGEVRMRLALPGDVVEYPLEVRGDPEGFAYQWVRVGDHAPADSIRSLDGTAFLAPPLPGFYKLLVLRGTDSHVLDELTLGVLVPFSQKSGTSLNGYSIGTYIGEAGPRKAAGETPEGFLPVDRTDVSLPLTKHLRVGDFLVHDGQKQWPRYVALQPTLLDKLELVLGRLAEWRGEEGRMVSVSVNSGFRTPAYNRSVPRAARNSRHQYGDAADLVIDADGDGRITADDLRLVARAVEEIEREHPELVGGLGIYTSARYRRPYVHIDASGRRARWRG